MPVMIWMDFKSNTQKIVDAAKERALSITKEPGFLWKIWTRDVDGDRPEGAIGYRVSP